MNKNMVKILISIVLGFIAQPAFAGSICDGFIDCLPLMLPSYILCIGIVFLSLGTLGLFFFRKHFARELSKFFLQAGGFLLIGLSLWVAYWIVISKVDYQKYHQNKDKAILQLPFTVYQGVLPQGTALKEVNMTNWHSQQDLNNVIVRTVIVKTDQKLWPAEKKAGDWTVNWAIIDQMPAKRAEVFPEKCPNSVFDLTFEYEYDCEFIKETALGNKLYRSVNPRYQKKEKIISVKLNDTFIVINYFRDFRQEDLEVLGRMIDTMQALASGQLKKLQAHR